MVRSTGRPGIVPIRRRTWSAGGAGTTSWRPTSAPGTSAPSARPRRGRIHRRDGPTGRAAGPARTSDRTTQPGRRADRAGPGDRVADLDRPDGRLACPRRPRGDAVSRGWGRASWCTAPARAVRTLRLGLGRGRGGGGPAGRGASPGGLAGLGEAQSFAGTSEMVALGADVVLTFIDPCTRPGCAGAEPHGSHAPSTAPPPPPGRHPHSAPPVLGQCAVLTGCDLGIGQVPFGPRGTSRRIAGGTREADCLPLPAHLPVPRPPSPSTPRSSSPAPEGAPHLCLAGFATDGGVDGEPPRPRYLPPNGKGDEPPPCRQPNPTPETPR